MKIRSVRALRITTLAENSCGLGTRDPSSRCLGQWGLSFLLELVDSRGDNRKVIFDTGMYKQALLRNIKALKVNLRDLDCIVLSHGHLDHTAATVEIVKATGNTKIYAHPHTFLPGSGKTKQENGIRLEFRTERARKKLRGLEEKFCLRQSRERSYLESGPRVRSKE